MFRRLAYANRPYSCLSVALTVGNLGGNFQFPGSFHDFGEEKGCSLGRLLGAVSADQSQHGGFGCQPAWLMVREAV